MPAATLSILLSWASHLTGLPAPDALPAVEYQPHTFFVENACGGRECRVLGWYNDTGTVYIDERYRGDEGAFASSLIVHELAHFLQHATGQYGPDCEDRRLRELRARSVQQRYLVEATGAVLSVPMTSPPVCFD